MTTPTANPHPLGDLGFESASRTLHDLGFEPAPGRKEKFVTTRQRHGEATRRDRLTLGTKATAAVRAAMKEPALRPEMEAATNRPQAVGAVEGDSGRVITQPSDNPAANQALATEAMQSYRAELRSAIAKIAGARLAASRDVKNPRRLAEKIAFEGQPAQTVNDYGAVQISVDSPQALDAVVAAIRKRFPVLRVQDYFAAGDPKYGYRSYSMQLQMPTGASQELQIVPKEVFEVNQREHKTTRRAAMRKSPAGMRAPSRRMPGHRTTRPWHASTCEISEEVSQRALW